jgi:hypothetical protein
LSHWTDGIEQSTAPEGGKDFLPFINIREVDDEIDVEFLEEPRNSPKDKEKFWVDIKLLGARGNPRYSGQDRSRNKIEGAVVVGDSYTLDITPATLGRGLKDVFEFWGKSNEESKLLGKRCTIFRVPRTQGGGHPFYGVRKFEGTVDEPATVDLKKYVEAVHQLWSNTGKMVDTWAYENVKQYLDSMFQENFAEDFVASVMKAVTTAYDAVYDEATKTLTFS